MRLYVIRYYRRTGLEIRYNIILYIMYISHLPFLSSGFPAWEYQVWRTRRIHVWVSIRAVSSGHNVSRTWGFRLPTSTPHRHQSGCYSSKRAARWCWRGTWGRLAWFRRTQQQIEAKFSSWKCRLVYQTNTVMNTHGTVSTFKKENSEVNICTNHATCTICSTVHVSQKCVIFIIYHQHRAIILLHSCLSQYLKCMMHKVQYSSSSPIRPPHLPRNCGHIREVAFGEREKYLHW